MNDIMFVHQDGSTQVFPPDCSVAANLYAITHGHKIRAAHSGQEKAVFRDGAPVALVELSREQFLESI